MMSRLNRGKPRRRVVRTYGRDSLLGLANPLLALIVRAFGLTIRLKSEEQVMLEMERDAVAMIRRGYRIASSRQYEAPPFGAVWHQVTYELAEAGARDRDREGRPGGPGGHG
jgi:hypothetical protein